MNFIPKLPYLKMSPKEKQSPFGKKKISENLQRRVSLDIKKAKLKKNPSDNQFDRLRKQIKKFRLK